MSNEHDMPVKFAVPHGWRRVKVGESIQGDDRMESNWYWKNILTFMIGATVIENWLIIRKK